MGNAEPYDPRPREGLDSLFTSSVLAIRPKTGEIACHFQYTPNDVYDVDGTDENVLADIQIGGQLRKVMIQANKNGFLYVLDRTNCKLIAANPFVKVNWATHIDLATGRPVLTDVYKRFLAGEEVEIWPSRGTNAVPIAFNPNTGLVYASTWNVPRIQKLAPPKPQVVGASTTGVTARLPPTKPGDVFGHFAAINPLTGEKKWEVPLTDLPSSAGMLATGGGLVFTGKLTGEFVALDEKTGQDALAVQDRLERQFDGDHLHPQGPAIRDHRVGTGWRSCQSLCGGQSADWRLGVDVCVDLRPDEPFLEAGHIDDQRVSFPVTDGVSQVAGVQIVGMLLVQRDQAEHMTRFDQDHDQVSGSARTGSDRAPRPEIQFRNATRDRVVDIPTVIGLQHFRRGPGLVRRIRPPPHGWAPRFRAPTPWLASAQVPTRSLPGCHTPDRSGFPSDAVRGYEDGVGSC